MTAFRRDLYAGLGTARDDRADCAVRALAIATGRPYAEVQRDLARAGRVRHAPTDVLGTVARVAESYGGRLWAPFRPLALRRFMAGAGRRGNWAIFTDTGRHLFAARDGTIHDWDYRPGLRVYSAWQF
jgi:hypothetical protein